MKIIEQSFEVLKKEANKLLMIEKAGRICYKSEDKITKDSAEKFVKMLITSGHHAMLEHENIIILVPKNTYDAFRKLNLEDIRYMQMTNYDRKHLISGNIRAWRNLYLAEAEEHDDAETIIRVIHTIAEKYPSFFPDLNYDDAYDADIQFIKEDELTYAEKLLHQNITIKFITDRAVANEFVRHRNCGFAQESTHFIDYLKRDGLVYVWQAEIKSRTLYQELLGMNAWGYETAHTESKKVRRGLLPLCLKTELIITANIKEWRHMLTIRTTPKAHPQMRALMRSVLDWFKKELPIFVEDISYEES